MDTKPSITDEPSVASAGAVHAVPVHAVPVHVPVPVLVPVPVPAPICAPDSVWTLWNVRELFGRLAITHRRATICPGDEKCSERWEIDFPAWPDCLSLALRREATRAGEGWAASAWRCWAAAALSGRERVREAVARDVADAIRRLTHLLATGWVFCGSASNPVPVKKITDRLDRDIARGKVWVFCADGCNTYNLLLCTESRAERRTGEWTEEIRWVSPAEFARLERVEADARLALAPTLDTARALDALERIGETAWDVEHGATCRLSLAEREPPGEQEPPAEREPPAAEQSAARAPATHRDNFERALAALASSVVAADSKEALATSLNKMEFHLEDEHSEPYHKLEQMYEFICQNQCHLISVCEPDFSQRTGPRGSADGNQNSAATFAELIACATKVSDCATAVARALLGADGSSDADGADADGSSDADGSDADGSDADGSDADGSDADGSEIEFATEAGIERAHGAGVELATALDDLASVTNCSAIEWLAGVCRGVQFASASLQNDGSGFHHALTAADLASFAEKNAATYFTDIAGDATTTAELAEIAIRATENYSSAQAAFAAATADAAKAAVVADATIGAALT
jgi:hypothetical protein